jgi:hypothetical protein
MLFVNALTLALSIPSIRSITCRSHGLHKSHCVMNIGKPKTLALGASLGNAPKVFGISIAEKPTKRENDTYIQVVWQGTDGMSNWHMTRPNSFSKGKPRDIHRPVENFSIDPSDLFGFYTPMFAIHKKR